VTCPSETVRPLSNIPKACSSNPCGVFRVPARIGTEAASMVGSGLVGEPHPLDGVTTVIGMDQKFFLEGVTLVIPGPEAGQVQRLPADASVRVHRDGAWSAWVRVKPPHKGITPEIFQTGVIVHGEVSFAVTRGGAGVWMSGFGGGFSCRVDGVHTAPVPAARPARSGCLGKAWRRVAGALKRRQKENA
jgi:hypothetical protein